MAKVSQIVRTMISSIVSGMVKSDGFTISSLFSGGEDGVWYDMKKEVFTINSLFENGEQGAWYDMKKEG